jgi:hypothetical protein
MLSFAVYLCAILCFGTENLGPVRFCTLRVWRKDSEKPVISLGVRYIPFLSNRGYKVMVSFAEGLCDITKNALNTRQVTKPVESADPLFYVLMKRKAKEETVVLLL